MEVIYDYGFLLYRRLKDSFTLRLFQNLSHSILECRGVYMYLIFPFLSSFLRKPVANGIWSQTEVVKNYLDHAMTGDQ